MQQLMSVWTGLSPRRQAIVAGTTLAVFLAVLGLARLAAQPGMALLYAGVDGMAAGEMMQALDARNIRYEVRGDAIYVPAPVRDETRMMLAAQGLPSGGGRGYELLDGLSGFGTTSQMFDAAYWRAKEGELARTIVASPAIRAARVHIAHVAAQPFRREIAPTASVTITPAGGGLPAGQARALRFLVASAVPGMRAEDVAVIDGVSGTILQAEEAAPGNGSDREAELRKAVERILEAHVGRGRAVVELSLETVTDTESIRERRIDPDSRVPILSESEERTNRSSDTHAPGVTVASNLPDGDANADGGRSESQSAETRERVNFDISEVSRELHRAPGAIRRLTVAALVDGTRAPDEGGRMVWQPRPAEELEALRELIAAAVGYDAERGDVISLKSLPLEMPLPEGSEAPTSFWTGLDPMTLIQLAVLAAVALALGLFVLRPILAGRTADADALPAPDDAAPAGGLPGPAQVPALGNMAAPDGDALPALAEAPAEGDAPAEDPVQRLRRLIAERQDETLQILQNWMEDADGGRT